MLNGEDIPELQHKLYPTDHQPVIIEQYRGPLLDQLREQEAEAKLMPLGDQATTVRCEFQPALYPIRHWIASAGASLQNLGSRVSRGSRLLTGPFGAGDDILDWARIGILFQLISVLTLIAARLVFDLLPIQFMILLGSLPATIAISFYLVGLFNSTRAAVLYHRSSHPRATLALGLIPYIALVIGILLIIGIFK